MHKLKEHYGNTDLTDERATTKTIRRRGKRGERCRETSKD
jgi:hypothetical protein